MVIDSSVRSQLTAEECRAYDLGLGLDEVIHRYFAFTKLFQAGQLDNHRLPTYCEGLGMGIARMLRDPRNAPLSAPIPDRMLRGILLDADRRAAFWAGYEHERERLASMQAALAEPAQPPPR